MPENQTVSGRQGEQLWYNNIVFVSHCRNLGVADRTQRKIANGAATHNFTATKVGAMGSMDMAYERGNFEFFNADNEVLRHGRYTSCNANLLAVKRHFYACEFTKIGL